jgi:hypothetical protein
LYLEAVLAPLPAVWDGDVGGVVGVDPLRGVDGEGPEVLVLVTLATPGFESAPPQPAMRTPTVASAATAASAPGPNAAGMV